MTLPCDLYVLQTPSDLLCLHYFPSIWNSATPTPSALQSRRWIAFCRVSKHPIFAHTHVHAVLSGESRSCSSKWWALSPVVLSGCWVPSFSSRPFCVRPTTGGLPVGPNPSELPQGLRGTRRESCWETSSPVTGAIVQGPGVAERNGLSETWGPLFQVAGPSVWGTWYHGAVTHL